MYLARGGVFEPFMGPKSQVELMTKLILLDSLPQEVPIGPLVKTVFQISF